MNLTRIGILSSSNGEATVPFPTLDRVGLWVESGMVNNGTIVTEWQEATGNNKDWVGIPTNEPAYASADGLVGDGADEMTMSPVISLAPPFTIYIEMKLGQHNCEILGGSGARYLIFFGPTEINSRIANSAFATNLAEIPISGNFMVLAVQYEGGTTPVKTYINGGLHGTWNSVDMGGPFQIDSLFGEGAPYLFRGNIRKLAIFQHTGAVHTAEEIATNSSLLLDASGGSTPPTEQDYELQFLSSDTEFNPMDGNGLVSYGGNLLNLGGWFNSTNSHNQIWQSSNGVSWTQLANAPWHKRHTFGHGVMDSKIWVYGGDLFFDGNVPKNVWTYDGVSWTEVTDNWGIVAGDRVLFAWANDSTHLYMAGGQNNYGTTPTMFTDVVRSTDGITWEKLCDLPISYFSTGTMVVFNNKLFIMSGGRYKSTGHDNYNNKVYSYDLTQGTMGSWVEVATVNTMISMYANSYVWDGKIWHIMGYHAESGGNKTGIRFSTDGATWELLNDAPSARHASGITVHNDELYIVAGNLHNDSYKVIKTI